MGSPLRRCTLGAKHGMLCARVLAFPWARPAPATTLARTVYLGFRTFLTQLYSLCEPALGGARQRGSQEGEGPAFTPPGHLDPWWHPGSEKWPRSASSPSGSVLMWELFPSFRGFFPWRLLGSHSCWLSDLAPLLGFSEVGLSPSSGGGLY